MKTWALLLLAPWLGGCAVAPPAADPERLFADSLFSTPSEPVDARAVFAVNDAMRKYLATELKFEAGTKGRQNGLAAALRSEGLKLEYDAVMTRNAAQAFEGRTGNCLSLVIMTAALAKEMGVGVRFQSVYVEETWNRIGDLYFSVGHVNLTLGTRPPALGTRLDDGESLLIDFQAPRDLRGINWRVVGEQTILAMYMNNRAAESLAGGRADDAYWFAREAIRQDPLFAPSYNTLGIIYLRRGHLAEAERTLSHALAREPRNTLVMSNMVSVLERLGRVAESQELERRLAQLEPDPAFTWFNRGLAAMREGDFRTARDLFAKEVDRAPYYHEFQFWLALALANLGDTERAKRHLLLAMENSTSRKDHDLYATKLDRIKSVRLH